MIQITSLSKSFPNNKKRLAVLHNISFVVGKGEIVAILGPSGSGKSTLLDLIAGFQQADCGSVVVDGAPVQTPSAQRTIILQEETLFPWLNAFDNVAYSLNLRSCSRHLICKKVDSIINDIGLSDYKSFFPKQLSGGMKKRLEFARAFVAEPSAILMDEAFSSLDMFSRNNMYQVFRKLWEQTKPTVCMVTHDIEEALLLADKIVILSAKPAKVSNMIDIEFPANREAIDVFSEQFVKLRQIIYERLQENAQG